MKKRSRVIDIVLIAAGVILVLVLWQAPPVSTARMPYDDTHREFYDLVRTEGKKAAEARCETCHNAEMVPFPPDHPPKYRCLLCHKLEERP